MTKIQIFKVGSIYSERSTSKPLRKCCVQKKKKWRQEHTRNCQASPGCKWLAGEKPTEAYTRLGCRCMFSNKTPYFDGTSFISSRVCGVSTLSTTEIFVTLCYQSFLCNLYRFVCRTKWLQNGRIMHNGIFYSCYIHNFKYLYPLITIWNYIILNVSLF